MFSIVGKNAGFLIGMLVCTVVFVGCADKDLYDPDRDPNRNPEGGASNLDFSTSKTVKMDFNYDVTEGFVSNFRIYDQNPYNNDGTFKEELSPIAGGIHIAGQPLTRVLPSYAEELYLYTPSLFVPRLSHAVIANGMASFEQTTIPGSMDNTSRATPRSIGNKKIDRYLTTANDFDSDRDLKTDHYAFYEKPPKDVLTQISSTFKEGEKADSKFYADATVELKQDEGQGVRVYISILHAAGEYKNSLSYFTYTGEKSFKEFTEDEIKAIRVTNIFKYANTSNNSFNSGTHKNKGLTPGRYVQLEYYNEETGKYQKEFPVGTKIGWILHSNAFNGMRDSDGIKTGNNWYYSTPSWNQADKHGNNRTTYFQAPNGDKAPYNCFGFEDDWEGDGDCNDVIFRVLTDPVKAVVPPPSIEYEDIEDTETKTGILAFEDFWPEQGDYDLNDVIVEYNSTLTYLYQVKKEDGKIVEEGEVYLKKLNDTFTILNDGADYTNSFSYKMDVNPSYIKSIKIDGQDYIPVKDGSGFIVDICTSVKGLRLPKEYKVEIEFEYGKITQNEFAKLAAPYNPFILPVDSKYENAEIHLPNYRPTNRVNTKLFGTAHDHSDQKTLWYVGGKDNLYPFAIHLAEPKGKFKTPTEKARISESYDKYIIWVESGMKEEKDWYLYPNTK